MKAQHIANMPEILRPRKEESSKLFKSKFMEAITRTAIWVPWVILLPISVLTGLYGVVEVKLSLVLFAALFVVGAITWTFAEYMIHRFFYHTFFKTKWVEKIQFSAHWIHHQHPRDKERLAMPPLPALFLASVFFLVFWLPLGKYVFAFYPGFLLGYLAYITLHYAQHRYKVPAKIFQKLWQHHAMHHYKYPDKAFGVSTRLWDKVFGTMP